MEPGTHLVVNLVVSDQLLGEVDSFFTHHALFGLGRLPSFLLLTIRCRRTAVSTASSGCLLLLLADLAGLAGKRRLFSGRGRLGLFGRDRLAQGWPPLGLRVGAADARLSPGNRLLLWRGLGGLGGRDGRLGGRGRLGLCRLGFGRRH